MARAKTETQEGLTEVLMSAAHRAHLCHCVKLLIQCNTNSACTCICTLVTVICCETLEKFKKNLHILNLNTRHKYARSELNQ